STGSTASATVPATAITSMSSSLPSRRATLSANICWSSTTSTRIGGAGGSALTTRFEDLPHLGQQRGLGERLLDQADARLEVALRAEHRLRVAGHVEHTDRRALGHDPLGDLLPEHLGHDDVGQQQIDRAVVGGDQLE